MKIWKKIIFIILAIAANYLGRLFTGALNLPFWLDTCGTIASAMYLGALPGVITAACSSLIFGISNPASILYMLVTIPIALATYRMKKAGAFDTVAGGMINAYLLSLIAVGVSLPLNLWLYNGYSGNTWGDTTVDMLLWNKIPIVIAALAGELAVDFFDKQVSVLLIFAVEKLIKLIKKKKINAKAVSAMLAAGLILPGLIIPSFTSNAKEPVSIDNTIYDRTNGLLSPEANCIAETPDGTIWIGSYASLLSFDGRNFTFIKEGGIANVNDLYTDSKGRLFIGTNDSGIAVLYNGEYTFYTEDDGLPSESIRCFAEDSDGDILIGTSEGMCKITSDGSIATISNGLSYVNSLVFTGSSFLCTDNSGSLYFLSADAMEVIPISIDSAAEDENKTAYEGVYACGERFLVATSKGEIQEVNPNDLSLSTIYSNLPIGDIKYLYYDGEKRLWVGGQSGYGYYDESAGDFHEMTLSTFATSVSSILEDYQGNIWICSGDRGVLKFSESAFSHPSSEVYDSVTNAVILYKGSIYAGTDSGLFIIDSSGNVVQNELADALMDKRIRCLMADSNDNLWISTYSDFGLIESDGSTIVNSFNTGNSDITSDRVRVTKELSDGSIAVGTADGLNIIKDGAVNKTYKGSDGLKNSQILSIEEEDGKILAGTDGAGIYVIRDGEIESNIGKSEGLNSGIILRIVPFDGGYFIVTSNSISYLKDNKAKTITNFPYFNNFDIMIHNASAYVLSSAGIYVVDPYDMVNDKENMSYSLYGVNGGLDQAAIANSYGFIDGNDIYFCTASGFMKFQMDFIQDTDILYGLGTVYADDRVINPDSNGKYIVPADTSIINIYPSVRNYSQNGVYVRLNIEGVTKNKTGVLYEEAQAVSYTNPSKGTYNVTMEIMPSPNGKPISTTEYTLIKEPHSWESKIYMAYLIFVSCALVAYTTWVLIGLFTQVRRKNELENMRNELENELGEKTKVIEEKEKETERLLVETVEALTNTIDAKDTYTSGHSRRVAKYSRMLAERLGKSKEECDLIYRAGLLHDVGKIRVPEEVINKPGRLTDEEFEMMKIHPVAGFRIINGISWDKRICYGARFHHERYDGNGYPDKRAGEDIPEIARIIGVADAYDAMSSNRSYRSHMPQDKVREQIENGRGKQFDPEVADAMLELIDEDKDYRLCQTDMGKRTVLITDDEKMSMMMAKKILMSVGEDVEILYAENHEKEMEILEKNNIDLLLQDIWMPDGYGLDIMKEVHEKQPDLPIIIMSGDKELKLFEEAINSGAADFISKPFAPNVLKEMVRGILYD